VPLFSSQKSSKGDGNRRIGLNIGRANITASEVSAHKSRFVIEHCASQPIQTNKPLGRQLKEFLLEHQFQAKKANVSLKGHGVVVRFLSFPRMDRADFTSAIQFEAEKYLPFNLSEVVMDFHIVDEPNGAKASDNGMMQVILVAARKTEVERIVAAAKEAEMQLDAIDVDIFAIANLFTFVYPEAKSHVYAVVDFGTVDVSLGILNKGALTFSRDIAFGANDLMEFMKRKLNVSGDEALKLLSGSHEGQADQNAVVISEGLNRLIQELRSSVNYYYNQHENASPIETIYISGGLSQLVILKSMLQKQMEIPISSWDPVPAFQLNKNVKLETLKTLSPYLPVSLGLAIRPR
jgi:type IV pilus assembly protein PilM